MVQYFWIKILLLFDIRTKTLYLIAQA